MPNVADYAARLKQATSLASSYLSDIGYVNPISREHLYRVKTVLPGVDNVSLTLGGIFEVATMAELSFFPSSSKAIKSLPPRDLISYIVKAARQQGNVMPSYINVGEPLEQQIQGLLECLVNEIEVLPQVVALEQEGKLSKTKELLRAGR